MDYFATIENDLRDAFARDVARRRRRQQRLAGGAVASLAVAVAAAVAIAVTPSGGGDRFAELLRTASAQAQTTSLRPVPITVAEGHLSTFAEDWFSVWTPSTTTITPSAEGVRVATTGAPPTFPGARDRARWRAAGAPRLDAVGGDSRTVAAGRAADPSWGDLDAVPTDPKALLALLQQKADVHDHPTDELLNLSADLLAEPAARPALRAAVFAALADADGLQVEDDATDRDGRDGVAITLSSDASGVRTKTSLIFDRDSTRPLSVETQLLEPVRWVDAAPGTVIDYRTYRYG